MSTLILPLSHWVRVTAHTWCNLIDVCAFTHLARYFVMSEVSSVFKNISDFFVFFFVFTLSSFTFSRQRFRLMWRYYFHLSFQVVYTIFRFIFLFHTFLYKQFTLDMLPVNILKKKCNIYTQNLSFIPKCNFTFNSCVVKLALVEHQMCFGKMAIKRESLMVYTKEMTWGEILLKLITYLHWKSSFK